MKVAEYIQKNKEAMPPELAEMLTQETSIWSNDRYYHIIRKWRGIFFVQYKGYNR